MSRHLLEGLVEPRIHFEGTGVQLSQEDREAFGTADGPDDSWITEQEERLRKAKEKEQDQEEERIPVPAAAKTATKQHRVSRSKEDSVEQPPQKKKKEPKQATTSKKRKSLADFLEIDESQLLSESIMPHITPMSTAFEEEARFFHPSQAPIRDGAPVAMLSEQALAPTADIWARYLSILDRIKTLLVPMSQLEDKIKARIKTVLAETWDEYGSFFVDNARPALPAAYEKLDMKDIRASLDKIGLIKLDLPLRLAYSDKESLAYISYVQGGARIMRTYNMDESRGKISEMEATPAQLRFKLIGKFEPHSNEETPDSATDYALLGVSHIASASQYSSVLERIADQWSGPSEALITPVNPCLLWNWPQLSLELISGVLPGGTVWDHRTNAREMLSFLWSLHNLRLPSAKDLLLTEDALFVKGSSVERFSSELEKRLFMRVHLERINRLICTEALKQLTSGKRMPRALADDSELPHEKISSLIRQYFFLRYFQATRIRECICGFYEYLTAPNMRDCYYFMFVLERSELEAIIHKACPRKSVLDTRPAHVCCWYLRELRVCLYGEEHDIDNHRVNQLLRTCFSVQETRDVLLLLYSRMYFARYSRFGVRTELLQKDTKKPVDQLAFPIDAIPTGLVRTSAHWNESVMGKLGYRDNDSVEMPFKCPEGIKDGRIIPFLQPLGDFYLPMVHAFGHRIIDGKEVKKQRRLPPWSYYIVEMTKCMAGHELGAEEGKKKKKPRKSVEYSSLNSRKERLQFYSLVSKNFQFDLVDAAGGTRSKLSAERDTSDASGQLNSETVALLVIYYCNHQPASESGISLPIRLSHTRLLEVVRGMRKAVSARQKTRFVVATRSALEGLLRESNVTEQEAAKQASDECVKEKDAKYIPERLGGLKKSSSKKE